jgi:hypothetical protein
VGKTVLDFSFIRDRVVAVVDRSVTVALVVLVLSSIFSSIFAPVVPLTVLFAVDEIALVNAQWLREDAFVLV